MFRNFLTHRSFPSTRSIPTGLHLYFSSPVLHSFPLFHCLTIPSISWITSFLDPPPFVRYFSVNRLFVIPTAARLLPPHRFNRVILSTNRLLSKMWTPFFSLWWLVDSLRYSLQTKRIWCESYNVIYSWDSNSGVQNRNWYAKILDWDLLQVFHYNWMRR